MVRFHEGMVEELEVQAGGAWLVRGARGGFGVCSSGAGGWHT